MVVTVLHLFSGVSLTQCAFNLRSLKSILTLSMGNNISAENVVSSVPRDPRTLLHRLGLGPQFERFVCCPRCFYTYAIDPDHPDAYPDQCTHRRTSKSAQCGQRLRRTRKRGEKNLHLPQREFLYHDIRHWIGRMYGRPDIETLLDSNPWKSSNMTSETMDDMWHGSVLRDLIGTDNLPFIVPCGNESRLVFGLNYDSFNPMGGKIGKKSVSVGGIYMVCLNLPPAVRYKTENVYLVGIVPGPHCEPNTEQISHILRPLVTDMLMLWETGLYLAKTPRYPHGRRVRCAMVPLICDLPAARTVSGFGSYSCTDFCSECQQTIHDKDNFDFWTWKKRDPDEHRRHAEAWRDAETVEAREALFERHHLRWSELLRLPYWNPVKFTIIDSMHCFYLRIFQYHCRNIFGMDINIGDGMGISFEYPSIVPDKQELEVGLRVLRYGTSGQLRLLPAYVKRHICRLAGLRFSGTSKALFKLLREYVRAPPS